MEQYKRVEDAARVLNTSVEMLEKFRELGWISTVEKHGTAFLASHQAYRARFILDLQRKCNLDEPQVSKVLAEQRAPYSLKEVDQILCRPLH